MSIGGFFLLLILAIIVIAAVVWFTGLAGSLSLQRDRRGSDKAVGAGAAEDGDRPVHQGGVPEQEEREKTEFVPRSGVPSGGD
jgi:hypothetical protein